MLHSGRFWRLSAFVCLAIPGCAFVRISHNKKSHKLSDSGVVVSTDRQKAKVLLLSSSGGGGHTSAAAAICSYLGDTYDVEIVQLIGDIFADVDPIRFFSVNRCSGEDVYNFFLRHGLMRCGGAYMTLGKAMSPLYMSTIEDAVEQYLMVNRPDAIISLIPLVNEAVYRVASRLHIPFSIIAVDLDTINYTTGMHRPSYQKFWFALPFDEPSIYRSLQAIGIGASQLRVVGFPVRTDFLERSCSKEQLRIRLQLPQDKPIVMVLMGAAGSQSVVSYARKMAKLKLSVHIIFCIGRNHALRDRIDAIRFPAHITISIYGFTNHIADLMRASDLLITKPGPTTVCEALYARVPLLLDYTSELLFWEHMNVDFVCRYGFGEVVTSWHRVPWHITHLLENPDRLGAMRRAMEDFPLPDVAQNVRLLVQDMIDSTHHIDRSLLTL